MITIYAVFIGDRCVYVGRTKNLKSRSDAHKRGMSRKYGKAPTIKELSRVTPDLASKAEWEAILRFKAIGEAEMNYTPIWTTVPDSVGEEYLSGTSLLELAAKYKMSAPPMREKLESLGIAIRPSGSRKGQHTRNSKLSEEQIAWILEQDLLDVPHIRIAEQVSVTRERVRQICLGNGHATRRSRTTKVLAVQEQREARKIEKFKTVLAASEAWKAGASFVELSAMLGKPATGPNYNHGSSKISWLRSKYPGLFPHRKSQQWKVLGLTEQDRFARVSAISKDWIAGMTTREMAQRHGYNTTASLANAVHQFRKKFPDLFPNRVGWIQRIKNRQLQEAA